MGSQLVHQHTNVTNFDLYQYSEFVSKDIKESLLLGMRQGFTEENFKTEHWDNLKRFMDYLENDVIAFGYAIIYKRRLDIASLKYTLNLILSKYPPGILDSLMELVVDIYKGFYEAFKQTLLNIEYYELIPLLEKKYNRINSLLRQVKKEYIK